MENNIRFFWVTLLIIYVLYLCHHFSQKVLSVVESHLSTSNSIEAWTVIYFLSKKVKSRNPEHVISAFKDIIINPEVNIVTICDHDQ